MSLRGGVADDRMLSAFKEDRLAVDAVSPSDDVAVFDLRPTGWDGATPFCGLRPWVH